MHGNHSAFLITHGPHHCFGSKDEIHLTTNRQTDWVIDFFHSHHIAAAGEVFVNVDQIARENPCILGIRIAVVPDLNSHRPKCMAIVCWVQINARKHIH